MCFEVTSAFLSWLLVQARDCTGYGDLAWKYIVVGKYARGKTKLIIIINHSILSIGNTNSLSYEKVVESIAPKIYREGKVFYFFNF